jgi:biopolymer transport protein TolQ
LHFGLHREITDMTTAQHLSPWSLFLHADVIVKTIMLVLALASLLTWAVIADKLIRFRELRSRARGWSSVLSKANPLGALAEQLRHAPADPFARIYSAVSAEWDSSHQRGLTQTSAARDSLKERIARVAQIATGVEIENLQRGLQLLATVGSVAPFVGLFGTVWGIINSFQGIAATNNTSLSVVAPGISEALFATALGLVAAIPAVVAYNRASGDLGSYANRLGTLTGIVEVELSRLLEAGETRPGVGAGRHEAPGQPGDSRPHAVDPRVASARVAANGA